MKAIFCKLTISTLFVSLFFSPLHASYVSVSNPKVSPAPLKGVEENGSATVTFTLVEASNDSAPAVNSDKKANIHIAAILHKLKLKKDNAALIKGTLLNYFSVSYDTTAHKVTFIQKKDFPGFKDVTVSVPVEVIQNSDASSKELNGFTVELSATDKKTRVGESASSYTYTK